MKISPTSPEGCDSVPYMRYGHSALAIGDLVYIFGGRNDTHGACNTLFCFDTGKLSKNIFLQPSYKGSEVLARDDKKFIWSSR